MDYKQEGAKDGKKGQRAAVLAEKREKPISRIAVDLGINESVLRRWMQQAREAAQGGLPPFPDTGVDASQFCDGRVGHKQVAALMKKLLVEYKDKALALVLDNSAYQRYAADTPNGAVSLPVSICQFPGASMSYLQRNLKRPPVNAVRPPDTPAAFFLLLPDKTGVNVFQVR
jgi:hypothetical protein